MSVVPLFNSEFVDCSFNAKSMLDIPAHVTVAMEVDLDAIDYNYHLTQSILAPHCAIAGVVKADAYGLGMSAVAPTLWHQGCRHFFVAFIEEGMNLRAILPQATIYVLSGVLPQTEDIFLKDGFVPVSVDRGQIKRWQKYAQEILPSLYLQYCMSTPG